MPSWTGSSKDLFVSRNDPLDPRLGDRAQSISPSNNNLSSNADADLVLWGYPDDEGIRLNGGRVGAAEAPSEIRRVFYKLTSDPRFDHQPQILDAGNISLDLELAERHQQASQWAQQVTDANLAWVSLGGGHDYGYADGAGFLRSRLQKTNTKQLPLVLNFDAHLDVRPSEKNLNSGTPFYRLLNEFSGQFDFVELGLQPQCNSRAHFQWAAGKGARLVMLEEIEQEGLMPILKRVLAKHLGQTLWLSLDMDAMTSNEAPGCSQSWTTGLRARDLMKAFQWLSENFNWQALSIYETSPALDFDNRTSKLAAQFLHRFLSCRLARR